MRDEILRLENVFKFADAYPVLQGVSFCLEAGKGLCVAADRYDTKRALMGILQGKCFPDAGKIFINDRPVRLQSPEDAGRQGIFFADPELVIPTMSAASNLFLTNDAYYSFYGVASKLRMQKDAEALLREYGIDWMNPSDNLESSSIGSRLILSVLKAVTVKARVIVLEDLCGQLPEYETERLRQICEKVKKKGIGILGVTNQLNSRTPIYEELSVIKNQVTVRTFSLENENTEPFFWMYEKRTKLSESMQDSPGEQEQILLEAEGLRPCGREDIPALSFRLRRQEVLGIRDREWNTLPLFRRALKGEIDCGGTLRLEGIPLRLFGENLLFEYKIAVVSGDDGRKRVFDQMNIYDNITIMQKHLIYNKLGIINRRYQRYTAGYCLKLIHQEDMLQRYGRKRELRKMSVSDQLKMETARWLCVHPRLFIFYKPCGSSAALSPEDFRTLLMDIRKLQIPVLILSDQEEFLQQFCDRVQYLT